MTISKNLLVAILAMDSYNRGYSQGILGLDDPNAQIGPAKFLRQSSVNTNSAEFQAGFYAAAYDTPYGTVIAYRGTDDNFNPFTTAQELR